MKKPNLKQFIIGGALVTSLVGASVGAALTQPEQISADEEPPIVQEVKHLGEVADNHEDRITNVEKDVAVLQSNTSTSQSNEKVIVREVVTESPNEPVALPEPKPEPEVDPYLIDHVTFTNNYNKFGEWQSYECKYYLASHKVMQVSSGVACWQAGTQLPQAYWHSADLLTSTW